MHYCMYLHLSALLVLQACLIHDVVSATTTLLDDSTVVTGARTDDTRIQKQTKVQNDDDTDDDWRDVDTDPDIPVSMDQSAYFAPNVHPLLRDWSVEKESKDIDADDQTCQPRHIHISLGDEDENVPTKCAMTVSFSLPFTCTPPPSYTSTTNPIPSNEMLTSQTSSNIDIQVLYQQAAVPGSTHQSTKPSSYTKVLQVNSSHVTQYNTTSVRTRKYYRSDWIYHVPVTQLQCGTKYEYWIQVKKNVSSSVQNERVALEKDVIQSVDDNLGNTMHSEGTMMEAFYGDVFTMMLRRRARSNDYQMVDRDGATIAQEPRYLRVSKNSGYDDDDDVSVHATSGDKSSANSQASTYINTKVLGQSKQMTFTTAPPPPSPTSTRPYHPTKIAIVGDLGQTYNSTATMRNILTETRGKGVSHDKSSMSSLRSSSTKQVSSFTPASLLLCVGDMSYADTEQDRWDNWFELMEPIISHIPLAVTAGNHEVECDATTRIPFLAYQNRFYMPNQIKHASGDHQDQDSIDGSDQSSAVIKPVKDEYYGSDGNKCGTPSVFRGSYDYGNAYYSFTYGMVKTIVLSSYSDTSVGSIQYMWLENELKQTNRDEYPWVLVMMHTQFYTTFHAHNDEIQTTIMREAMEPLFIKYNVNFVFSGHDHAYLRTHPMQYGKVDSTGRSPIYFIVGEGGNREHHVQGYLHEKQEEWVDVRDMSVYGFGTLEVANSTWAYWRWIMDDDSDNNDREKASANEPSFADEFWIHNMLYP